MIERVISGGESMKKYGIISVFIFLLSMNISAKELPFIFRGARPLGMGGAFVAVSDDENALFYNPAGLADIKTSRFSPLNFQAEVGRNAYSFNRDALDVDLDNPQEVGNFLNKHIGDYGHVSASYFPNYIRPNFAFGLLGTANSNIQVHDRQYPKLVMDAIGDAAACAGLAKSFFDSDLLVGSNLKYLYRESLEHEYTVADITTKDFKKRVRDDVQNGGGVLLDLGIMYKINPSQEAGNQGPIQLGLSVNNLIGNKLGDAEDIDSHVDLGVSKRLGEFTLAADYVDIFHELGQDKDAGKRIHIGVEYAPTKILKLRAGFNQGYLTYGVGIDTGHLKFDLLTYAEEVGVYSGQKDDRRYVFRFGFGF